MIYRLRSEAQTDLSGIIFYLLRRSPSAARRYRQSFALAFDRLADNPHWGQARPDIDPRARHWIVSPYRILYCVLDERVEIVRIVHAARHLIPQIFPMPKT